MKKIREEDFTELIIWYCPYKSCNNENTEENDYGLRDEYECHACHRVCKVDRD